MRHHRPAGQYKPADYYKPADLYPDYDGDASAGESDWELSMAGECSHSPFMHPFA